MSRLKIPDFKGKSTDPFPTLKAECELDKLNHFMAALAKGLANRRETAVSALLAERGTASKDVCTCVSRDLFIQGCKCGFLDSNK